MAQHSGRTASGSISDDFLALYQSMLAQESDRRVKPAKKDKPHSAHDRGPALTTWAGRVTPIIQPVRGGTDGAQLSFKGLPCPNIFAGGVNFHGPYEFVSIQVMEKAMQVVTKICEITAQYND